jgi:DNA invertase Pin-like site-specific DNA recombinase
MNYAIGYLRVSTKEQGRSGLSLAAQRFDIEQFGKREGFSVLSWHQDIQTGGGKDAILQRPGLAAALKEARRARCALIVSRLDRLSRNVHFIAGLMEHKIHFLVALFGRDMDHFTLHIYASIAEQERKMIGERVKAAAAIAKSQGRPFGMQLRNKAWQRKVSAMGRAALVQEANERAQAYRIYIEWALKQPGKDGRLISFRGAAIRLYERNIKTPLGGTWRGHHIQRMARRLSIAHPLARMPLELARTRVRALYKLRPNLTCKQLLANLGTERLLWDKRAYRILKECRRDDASRSAVHRKVGWHLDYRTANRVRVGEMWKRHPDITGKQVITRLKLGPEVPLKWVQKIMHECWRAHRKPNPIRQRGRTFYSPWRTHRLPAKPRSIDQRRATP